MAAPIEQKSPQPVLPNFSPLSRCLLIDASFRSRNEVVKAVKASVLFEEILEASSVVDGLKRLNARAFDACIIGPSLSQLASSDFIRSGKNSELSKHCAFVLLVEDITSVSEELLKELAHEVVEWPVTKSRFHAGVVRAILRASESSPWPGIRLSDVGELCINEGGDWKVYRESEDTKDTAEKGQSKQAADGSEDSIAKLIGQLDANNPKESVALILNKLVSKANKGKEGSKPDPFTEFFIEAVRDWLIELEFEKPQIATKNLRSRLRSYQFQVNKKL